ncbi:MAG: YtoQ family protein [Pseudomonadota bacterium]
MTFRIYLSGEIHTDWRDKIKRGIGENGPDIEISSPVADHGASDNVGVDLLGEEEKPFWKDHKGAKINAIRSNVLISKADVVVVRFGDKYKQWNAAFDAGMAVALNKPLIVIHAPELTHPLKEIDAAALAVAETPQQAVEILKYVSQP